MKSYAIGTSKVKTVFSGAEFIPAVTYDSIRDKLYWSGYTYSGDNKFIFRGNTDGTEVEVLLSTDQCKFLFYFPVYYNLLGNCCQSVRLFVFSFT